MLRQMSQGVYTACIARHLPRHSASIQLVLATGQALVVIHEYNKILALVSLGSCGGRQTADSK